MNRVSLPIAIGISILPAALLAAPLEQSQSIDVGNTPAYTASDPVTGRVLVSNAGFGRSGGGTSLAVVEPNGHITQLATPSPPSMIAVSAANRKAVIGQSNCACVAIVDIDTLAVSTVATGTNQMAAVAVDATGFAYVATRGALGKGTSAVTAIDLRTGRTTSYPVDGFAVVDMAANASGTRLYLIGTDVAGFAESRYGYVQAFDVASGTMVGSRMQIGREAQQVIASPLDDGVYILGHVDITRDLPPPDPRIKGIRPALFVLEGRSLALQRAVDLPDTKDLALYGSQIAGNIALDAESKVIYALDKYNQRFSVVDVTTGQLRAVDLESIGFALAFNGITKTVVVQLAFPGAAAVYSRAGERLDTVPFGRPASAGQFIGSYQMTVDSRGNVYGTDSYHGALAILRPSAEAKPSVVNLTDLWSNPAEPGWGVFVQQQGMTALAALFTHDAAGLPEWLIMPNGARQADGSFVGALYRTRGPVADAVRNAVQIGTLRFAADTQGGAALSYDADGVAVAKSVQRLRFDATPRTCAWNVGTAPATPGSGNFTGLWWNAAEPGWGLAVSQQGDTTFGVLFTYDASNRPTWSVMSNGTRESAGSFRGSLFVSPAGNVRMVGELSLDFASAESGALKYRVDGTDSSKSIVRQEFSAPSSRCVS